MNHIVDFKEIEQFLHQLRDRSSKRIAFTNGCFDLLHRGHVEYLVKAKSMADLLVVGLNSDQSVRRLKGSGRPLMNADDRAYILTRLEAVDIVCVFGQDTPLELIKKVRPDFLIKGGDYAVENIVGREFVESYGGKVLTVPLVAGRSTSGLVEKVAKLKTRSKVA